MFLLLILNENTKSVLYPVPEGEIPANSCWHYFALKENDSMLCYGKRELSPVVISSNSLIYYFFIFQPQQVDMKYIKSMSLEH